MAANYLVGLVKEADTVSYPQGIHVIRLTALRELVWLNILKADDGLRHDATVPVSTEAFFPCGRYINYAASSRYSLQLLRQIYNVLCMCKIISTDLLIKFDGYLTLNSFHK